MSRKGQPSQWDFGELFTPEQTRVVLTVGELTAKIRRVLEKEVASVWVSGVTIRFVVETCWTPAGITSWR